MQDFIHICTYIGLFVVAFFVIKLVLKSVKIAIESALAIIVLFYALNHMDIIMPYINAVLPN